MKYITKDDKNNLVVNKDLVSIVAGVIIIAALGFLGYKYSGQPVQNQQASASGSPTNSNQAANSDLGRKILTSNDLSKQSKAQIIAGIMKTKQMFVQGDAKIIRQYLLSVNSDAGSDAKTQISNIPDDQIKAGAANYLKYFGDITAEDLSVDNAEWSTINGIYFVKITKNGEVKEFGAKNVDGVWQ
jgi:hypothetical protein